MLLSPVYDATKLRHSSETREIRKGWDLVYLMFLDQLAAMTRLNNNSLQKLMTVVVLYIIQACFICFGSENKLRWET